MMNESSQLAVIIPARNAETTIGAQLTALAGQRTELDFEVIVVDNNSTDRTAEIVRAAEVSLRSLRLVVARDLSTPGYARNAGVAASTSALLAFCDADDVVGEGFVEAAYRALGRHPVVMGKIDYSMLNPPWLVASRGAEAVDRLDTFDGVFPYVVSACLAIRRHEYEQVGGFDEYLRVGQDIEFAWRLFLAGIPVEFDGTMVVHYRMRAGAKSMFRQACNFGRARMEIRSRVAAQGYPVGGIKWRNVLWLLRHLGGNLTRVSRYRWLNVAGNLWGEIRGPAPLAAPVSERAP